MKFSIKKNEIDDIIDPKQIEQIDTLIEKLKIADELNERVSNHPLQKIDVLSKALLSLPEDATCWPESTKEMCSNVSTKISELIKQI